MAEIINYTPTAGLENRTLEGFKEAITAWIERDIEPQISDLFDIDYEATNGTNDAIKFTPKDENLINFPLVMDFSQQNAVSLIGPNNSSGLRHLYLTTDPVFHFYESGGNVIFGMNAVMCYYNLFRGKRFDGTKASAIFNNRYFNTQGSTYTTAVQSIFNRLADGITSHYRIQAMPIATTDIVLSDVYYFDGGMSIPPEGEFKVGNDKYCTVIFNVAIKL